MGNADEQAPQSEVGAIPRRPREAQADDRAARPDGAGQRHEVVLALRNELPSAVEALTQYQKLAGEGEAAKASSLLDNLHRSLDAAKKESS